MCTGERQCVLAAARVLCAEGGTRSARAVWLQLLGLLLCLAGILSGDCLVKAAYYFNISPVRVAGEGSSSTSIAAPPAAAGSSGGAAVKDGGEGGG